jgi:hypothetical protein
VIPPSVLDRSPLRGGGAPADAGRAPLEPARVAERLGDHRLAEHPGTAGLAGAVTRPGREGPGVEGRHG